MPDPYLEAAAVEGAPLENGLAGEHRLHLLQGGPAGEKHPDP